MGYRSGFDLLLNVHQTRRFVEFTTVSLCQRDTNYAAIANSHRCFSLRTPQYSLFAYGRSAASGLPCAGAAPPQRPPTKTCLTDRVHSSPASCLANGVYSPTCRLNPPPTEHYLPAFHWRL